jgi:hypothetical protein
MISHGFSGKLIDVLNKQRLNTYAGNSLRNSDMKKES